MGTEFAGGKLFSGQMLRPEQTLVSPGGRARLHYQGDGNLVVYLDGQPFWASHTDGQSAGNLRMQRDGNLVITDAVGPFASTRTHGHPGAMVQLQDDGNFVIYEDPNGPLAGTPIWASMTGRFTMGKVEPEPGPVFEAPTPLVGPVEFIDKGRGGVRDATGPRLITLLHAGDLLARAKNHGWSVVTAALDYAQSRNFHGVRTWTNLPAPEWWGVPPRPGNFSDRDSDHMDIIQQFSRELKSRGLRWLVSQGDLLWLYPDRSRACNYMDRLGRVLQAEGGADSLVLGVDAGNEAWNFTRCTDPVLMGAMLDAFLRQCPCPIRSMTSAENEGTLNQFDGPPVTITDKHGSRMAFRHAVERSFTVSYWDGKTHAYTIDSEGPGPGPHVSATHSPAEWMEPECMGAFAFACLMTRQILVVMSSPGVISDEPFEKYDELLSLAPRIATMLPQDIQSWREFHGGADRGFSPERILAVSGDNVRCDHVKANDGRIGCLVYLDKPGHLDLEAINNFEGEMWHPGTLERTPIQFSRGQRVPFDMRRARFLLGKWS